MSSALTKRKSEDMALMPPPPPPKKIKRPTTVLDEDVYTEALSHVIARDFFPGLLETKAQQEYLDALDSNDNDWIREAGNNLREAMTPDPYGRKFRRGTSIMRTPASVATTITPGRTPLPGRHLSSRRDPSATPADTEATAESDSVKVDTSLSLMAFQAKYTSEDNASFNEVLDKQNEERSTKYAHLRNDTNNLPSKRLLEYRRVQEQKQLAQGEDTSSSALVVRPSQDLDARSASYDSFTKRQGAKNSFFFDPEGVEDEMHTAAQAAEERSMAPPKRTNFAATRLPGPDMGSRNRVPASPSMSAVDDAIRGKPRLTDSEKGSVAGSSGAETPMVNGWKFVDEQPTEAEEAFASGEVRGQVVDEEEVLKAEREEAMRLMPKHEADGGGGGFKLSERGGREALLDRLVEKTSVRQRKKAAETKKEDGGVRGNMTPAARRLAGRLGTPARTPFVGDDKVARTPLRGLRTPGAKR